MMIMFHATVNTTATVAMGAFYPSLAGQPSWAPLLGVSALALVLVVATRGRLGLPAPTSESSLREPRPVDSAHAAH
jgi:hypothetical protein